MTPSLAPRLRIAFLSLIGLFLLVPPALSADYGTGVTAKILKKTSVTDIGQKIIYPGTDRAEVTAVTVELAPGAETGWHKHPVPVFAYVISGNLSVELEDGKLRAYHAGDAIIEAVNKLHNGKNVGAEPVKLAVFYLGVEDKPNVIKVKPKEKTGQQQDK